MQHCSMLVSLYTIEDVHKTCCEGAQNNPNMTVQKLFVNVHCNAARETPFYSTKTALMKLEVYDYCIEACDCVRCQHCCI